MTDWITVSISVVSVIISIIALFRTNKKSNAQLEIEIKKMIDEKKKAFIEKSSDEKIIIDYLIEEELNAYDKACALYIDKKVDKNRFKKDYFYEIVNLFDNENLEKIGKFNQENCKYTNLKVVYNEWKIK